jgi:hypothetical protein
LSYSLASFPTKSSLIPDIAGEKSLALHGLVSLQSFQRAASSSSLSIAHYFLSASRSVNSFVDNFYFRQLEAQHHKHIAAWLNLHERSISM